MLPELESPLKFKNPRLDADTPWKNILEIYFGDFLRFFLPDLAIKVDWSKGYVSLDKELQKIYRDSQAKKGIVDKLIKVWNVDNKEGWFLMHLEIQGFRSANFPARMFM